MGIIRENLPQNDCHRLKTEKLIIQSSVLFGTFEKTTAKVRKQALVFISNAWWEC
jgi:hypothetical protein